MNTAPRDAQKRKEEAAATFNSTLGQTVYKMGVSIAQQMAIQAVRAVEAMRGGPQAVLFWDKRNVPESVKENAIVPEAAWFCLVPTGVDASWFLGLHGIGRFEEVVQQPLVDGSVLFMAREL